MNQAHLEQNAPRLVKDVLGYLNFSSGVRDLRFLSALNELFALVEQQRETTELSDRSKAQASKEVALSKNDPQHQDFLAVHVLNVLEQGLIDLSKESEAFKIDDQAHLIIKLVRDHFFTAYRQFHADLLFHQTNEFYFNSLLVGKIFEMVLRQEGPWTDTDRIIQNTISDLNDYIGYRPVPVLEGVEKHQPYDKEWVAPVPLYIEGVGIACGKYRRIVEQALAIFRETDPQILYEACFNLDKLQELVIDPRAYDFDHPVNRKPNYHFGLWDPQSIDRDGFYCRFVTHQVTLEGIINRIESADTGGSDVSGVPMDELIYEAGAVLVGTMLMGAGICGDTPSTHDSETSLSTLMPIIAGYRDRFYEQIVQKVPEKMSQRIQKEAERLFQPFGGCRQNLNKQISKRRANQLQRMHLARIFARMGYFDAAEHQSSVISVTSARIMTQIDCLITEAHLRADRNQYDEAAANLSTIESWIRSGIGCGAIVDPWTIIGFGGNYSLFHSAENSIHDHRIDDLINLLEDVFDLYSRLQKEAAAMGNGDLQADLSDKTSDLAGWWDQYGSTEVSGLDSFSGADAWESAAKVSTALASWHQAGTAAGDIAFWNRHVERFNSTKAYVLLAEALLEQQDLVASMALMMHWLSRSETIELTEGDYSFHSIANRWMELLWQDPSTETGQASGSAARKKKDMPPLSFAERWALTKKFFDYTEANADQYWRTPEVELSNEHFESPLEREKREVADPNEPDALTMGGNKKDDWGNELHDEFSNTIPLGLNEEEYDEVTGAIDSIYSAAYENVTYHDTADDGIDDSMMEAPSPEGFQDADDFALMGETERISDRLTFIMTLSKLWKFVTEKIAVLSLGAVTRPDEQICNEITQYMDAWLDQVVVYISGLDALLRKVGTYKVPPPRGTTESLLEYDRHRGTKEILLDRIIWTQVDVHDAKMMLESYLGKGHWRQISEDWWKANESWQTAVLEANHFVFHGDLKGVKKHWGGMLKSLSRETILYVPTSRGGHAWAIVRCRCIQQAIMRLMEYAPRMGLLTETFKMLVTIKKMEETNTVSPGAITEFDRLVETAARAITQCIAISSKSWPKNKSGDNNDVLVQYMEQIVEYLLSSWLSHSRQIRISPIESIADQNHWERIKAFIKQYGHDIFTQQHMGFGNLRAMLHQGIGNFLQSLIKIKEDEGKIEMAATLIENIQEGRMEWDHAVVQLEIIFESIAENYSEYIDYNSTTTHSDHGEKIYMLLDMLRVQIGYERISWNLKPVYWVHDAMIRAGCDEAALLWEKAVAKKSVNAAEQHLHEYARLSAKYGMWLPSVHERLQERFVRPLQIDRMCGLVPKAIRQARDESGPKTAFAELYAQIETFAKEPMGVGFEMPEWLTALQDEVLATRTDVTEGEKEKDIFDSVPHFEQTAISRTQLDNMITQWNKMFRKK